MLDFLIMAALERGGFLSFHASSFLEAADFVIGFGLRLGAGGGGDAIREEWDWLLGACGNNAR